jgi:aspartyl-tRNA(Asn)/glutamyl-tRNA(Gln) amidotransferase subunit C
MALKREEVAHIARLAHMALDEEEMSVYQEQLSTILDYAERIQELDTEEIPPTATVLPLRTVLREDVRGDVLPREALLANAPESMADCFVVPPVVEKE